MLSDHAKAIKKDVDDVYNNKKSIDCLLKIYQEKPEKDFIQKYAETKIAIVGVDAFCFAIITAIVATILAIALIYYAKNLNEFNLTGFLYNFLLLILIILFCFPLYTFSIKLTKCNVFEKIIIEIQASNMQNNMQTKPDVISKLDAIISEVDEINKKIDALEKDMSNKIEANGKEIMSIKRKRWG